MDKGKWWDRSWNPLAGCSHASTGCEQCYAEKLSATRLRHLHPYSLVTRDGRWNGRVIQRVEKLDEPTRWKKPRRVFVCDMSDLFHVSVDFRFIAAVYGVMAACPRHTFIVLSKRAVRMLTFVKWAMSFDHVPAMAVCEAEAHNLIDVDSPTDNHFPPRNVWHGVTVENQDQAFERIPYLVQVPSTVRFLSMEPLLGEIDFREVDEHIRDMGLRETVANSIHWGIVGGESGPRARQCLRSNIEKAVFELQRANIPPYVKQLGSCYVDEENGIGGRFCRPDESMVGKIQHLREFAGRDMSEWPELLRIRKYPRVA
jgi:protein gp37